ncbi:MAG TPA: hybrid sensor histidine kinase/response regulator, partial [Bacteroidia bacterium]|nr:hybrid sensor histidine kinase/response regulator [Bacteroidia bacterium]
MNNEKIKILMIDDDKEDFQIIELIVKNIVHQKYSLDWTPSFSEGLKLIAQQQHDVYLVDYKLGAKTGLELIKKA